MRPRALLRLRRRGRPALLAALLLVCGACRDANRVSESDGEDRISVLAAGDAVKAEFGATSPVTFGDPLEVELSVRAPADYQVELTPIETSAAYDVEQFTTRPPRPLGAGMRQWSVRAVLLPTRSGDLTLPPQVVRYQSQPDLPPETLTVGPLTVQVRTLLSDAESVDKPREIAGPLAAGTARTNLRRWLAISGIVALALAAVTVVVVLLLTRRRAPVAARAIPAEQVALAMLRGLDPPPYFQRGAVADFYYELTEIVRTYVEHKFDIAAVEMTSDEFLRYCATGRASLPIRLEELRTFLEACDLVKYAAFEPRLEHAQQTRSEAERFVRESAAAARKGGAEAPSPSAAGQEAAA